ncbi:MAG: hypothetical protein ABI634_01565 [Acidobacteriota bacterium]
MSGIAQRIGALLVALALLLLCFFVIVRPWYLQWGATAAEARVSLPGDEIVGPAATQETRAITIDAPIERVWPWVAQLGQDRGGFYSFDLLENLVGCRMPTTDVLRPAAQQWALGDRLWMYPPDRAGGIGYATLRSYVPGRAMGFGTHMVGTSADAPENGSWSFALEPTTPTTTRLIVRGRGTSSRSLLATTFDRGVFEPLHFAMERRMMLGLKELAETGQRARYKNHAQVGLWLIMFVIILITAWRVLIGHRSTSAVGLFVAAALAFQWLTLAQPSLWLAAPLTLLLWLSLGQTRSARQRFSRRRKGYVGR